MVCVGGRSRGAAPRLSPAEPHRPPPAPSREEPPLSPQPAPAQSGLAVPPAPPPLTHFRLHQLRRHLGLQRPPRREPPPGHVTPGGEGRGARETRAVQSAFALLSSEAAAATRRRGSAAPPPPSGGLKGTAPEKREGEAAVRMKACEGWARSEQMAARCGADRARLGVMVSAPKTAPGLQERAPAYSYCWARVEGLAGGREGISLGSALAGLRLGLRSLWSLSAGSVG